MDSKVLPFEKKKKERNVRKAFEEATEVPRRNLPDGAGKAADSREEIYDLLEAAEKSESPKMRVKLAKQVLAKDPDCSDAFLLLAEDAASTLHQTILHLESAVAAAERTMGTKRLQESKGHFWGITETRPYLRARAALAASLWDVGRRQEAIRHLEEMLELNPSDNQGLRYLLINWHLYIGDLASVDKLVHQYPGDVGLEFLFGRALSLYIREGKSEGAKIALRAALEQNSLAPKFILAPELIPEELPAYYSWGSPEEAMLFAEHASELWSSIPIALEWLNGEVRKKRRRKMQPVLRD